jgi:hypothetical protein
MAWPIRLAVACMEHECLRWSSSEPASFRRKIYRLRASARSGEHAGALLVRNLPTLPLQPARGEIYAHVFENQLTGVRRNLFWNLRVDFLPVTLDGVEWDCSFAIDWLTWPISTWHELDGMDLGRVKLPAMIETSLYVLAEHFPATVQELRIRARKGSSFEASVRAWAQIETKRTRSTVPISFYCPLQFAGVLVVGGNLEPPPTTAALAVEAVEQFIRLDGLKEPFSEDWRFVLEPE